MTKSKTLEILSAKNISEYPELARIVNNVCDSMEIEERIPENIEQLDEANIVTVRCTLFAISRELENLANRVAWVGMDYDEYLMESEIEPDEREYERELPEEEP